MRHIGSIIAVFLLLATIPAAADDPPISQLALDLQELYSKSELDEGVYVGSEFCLACHGRYSGWRDTRHAVALRRPDRRYSLVPGKGVVADFDLNDVDDFRQGLDFNRIDSAFNAYKPNAPILSFENGVYYMTIGQLRMRVVATQGGTGDWKQRYLLEVPVASGGTGGVSRENYVSPVQYNEATAEYVTYHPEAWYDSNRRPRFNRTTSASDLAAQNGRTYSKKCIGCHTTGVRAIDQTADGEWQFQGYIAILFDADDPAYFDYDRDGSADLVNIGCEACHGPGSLHILGGGDPRQIVNPADLSTDRANEVCGQCHVRVKSVPNGTHDWPYNDADGEMWRPGGERLSRYFRDASGRWPDGINSKQHHQQYFDFLESQKPDFAFHPVRCTECHAPHGDTTNRFLIRDQLVEGGVTIETEVDNNTLCLACHASFGPFSDLNKQMIAAYDDNLQEIAAVVSEHTHHPYASERMLGLSRCVSCHMPTIATSAVAYDIHSHSFEAISPEKTLSFRSRGGMPNSCDVSCHGTQVNIFKLGIDDDITTWNDRFDKQSARRLRRYFGPGGLWWDTDEDD